MGKYLKYTAIIMIVLYVLCSCKLYRQKSSAELRSSTIEKQRDQSDQWRYIQQRDSLVRYWYFWTDSSFRFHPDSGLSGHAGRLRMEESKVNSLLQQQKTAMASEVAVQTDARAKQVDSTSYTIDYMWIILLVLILLIAYIKKEKLLKLFSP